MSLIFIMACSVQSFISFSSLFLFQSFSCIFFKIVVFSFTFLNQGFFYCVLHLQATQKGGFGAEGSHLNDLQNILHTIKLIVLL